jgi:thymidylate synthase (FAD)
MLNELGHESPVEHVTFTFGIEGISRVESHQLVRHRIASYSQKSQRYVNEGQFDFITPPAIESDPDLNAMYYEYMMMTQKLYDTLRDRLVARHTQRIMLEDDVSEDVAKKKAEKLANEDARFVLPNACETKIVVTMNVRSLFNFFRHRCCSRAQWGIRAVADEMLRLCKEVAPHLFANAGPSCVAMGKCPEGKMTCGKYNEMQRKYKG